MARVAIVIVTHNSGEQIAGCLDALARPDVENAVEIVVVDNASSDGTRDEVGRRGIRLIANERNAGFGAAVNQGVRATGAPLILLLNPDAHLLRGLDVMADFTEQPGIGAVGGLLSDENGQPQKGFMARSLPSPAALILEVLGINRLWPHNPVNWKYRCLGLNDMTISAVDQPAGAFLMFSRAAWAKVGGFEESYWPIWFEDVDFCARLKSAGLRNYYHPAGVAKHAGAHSIRGLDLEKRERYWYGSLLEYASRHYGSVAFRTTCVAVVMGVGLRAVKIFPRFKFSGIEVYGSIAGLALRRGFSKRRGIRTEIVG
jgi:N-acetylglucosaminyl-diphospho-decaprenol L-rhamnosyltransferase